MRTFDDTFKLRISICSRGDNENGIYKEFQLTGIDEMIPVCLAGNEHFKEYLFETLKRMSFQITEKSIDLLSTMARARSQQLESLSRSKK